MEYLVTLKKNGVVESQRRLAEKDATAMLSKLFETVYGEGSLHALDIMRQVNAGQPKAIEKDGRTLVVQLVK